MNNWPDLKVKKKMVLGRYIVADPKVCEGRLTFRGDAHHRGGSSRKGCPRRGL